MVKLSAKLLLQNGFRRVSVPQIKPFYYLDIEGKRIQMRFFRKGLWILSVNNQAIPVHDIEEFDDYLFRWGITLQLGAKPKQLW